MELQDNDNIYQNNIAILSMSRVDAESGRTTVQFSPPPSQLANSQGNINNNNTEVKKCPKRGLYNLIISAIIITCLCIVLGVVITALKNKDLNIFAPSSSSLSSSSSLFLNNSSDTNQTLESITLNDILFGRLAARLFNGTWISDKIIAYYDEYSNLCLLNVNTAKKTILIPYPKVLVKQLHGDMLSRNHDYLLIPYDVSKTFRHSSLSKYKIYDILNDSVSYLLPNYTVFVREDGEYLIQYAEWGPYGTQIIFIYKNNIFYKPHMGSVPIQLTTTGKPNLVYNGYADWVYEEEVLSDDKAFWVSSDGKHLVYAVFNDTLVDLMSWNYYGDYHNISSINQYPATVSLRYPKPGRNNPTVKMFVINLEDVDEKIVHIPLTPPKNIFENDHYVSSVKWIDNDRVSITWLNRRQNFSVIVICDKKQHWKCNTSFSIGTSDSWVDFLTEPLVASAKQNTYFLKLPQLISEEVGYYQHAAVVNLTDRKVKFLTFGEFEIIELLAFNEDENKLYFLATLPNKPDVRHLMKVSTNEEKVQNPKCLTCNLGDSCAYNFVFISSDANYYALQCEGPGVPRVEIRWSKNNSLVNILESNENLKAKLDKIALPIVRKFRIKTKDKNYAKVSLLLPPNFNESLKYFTLIEVYGGPGSQLVTDKFRVNHWGSYLASNKSIIYARIDVRGSGNCGARYMHEVYHKLGSTEIEDVIAVARYFRDKVSYINGDAIAIWGWSYGGYATLMSLALDYADPALKCGIAVAPVTNWLLYDSIYVERYMGLPDDDPNAYNRSNLLNNAKNLKDKKILLAFGTADDNVHAQHSLLLMSALNELQIYYDTIVFPDNDHSLQGSTVYLYRRMTKFLDQCFNLL